MAHQALTLTPVWVVCPSSAPASRVKEEVRESRCCLDWARRKKGPEDSAGGGVGGHLDRSLGPSVRLEVGGREGLQVGAEDAEVMVGRARTCLGLAASHWRDSPHSPPTESSPGTWPFLYPAPPALGWLFLPPLHKEHSIFESRKLTSSLSLMVGDTVPMILGIVGREVCAISQAWLCLNVPVVLGQPQFLT